MAKGHKADSARLEIHTVSRDEVPKGREGKYNKVIEQIMRQIDQLAPGTALKVSLAALPATKARIRAALNRVTHKKGLDVATSSDSTDLYIWKITGKP